MKKLLYLILFIFIFIPTVIFGKENNLNIYLFYGDGCPHCAELEEYLNDYLKDKNITLHKYEVWYNEENQKNYTEVHKILKDKSNGIPYLIIGNNTVVGFDKKLTPSKINSYVIYYQNKNYNDEVGIYLNVVNENKKINSNKIENNKELILSTLKLSLKDEFSICLIWFILLFISILLLIKDNKKRIFLGLIFLIINSVSYFLFLTSYLDLLTFINILDYIKVIISSILIILGFYSLIKFVNKKEEKFNNKKIIIFILIILNVIILSFLTTIIKFLGSIGVSSILENILITNNINSNIYYLIYTLLYLFYNLIIFYIILKIFDINVISKKINKYSYLISGSIMLIISLLIIFKLEWLMLNF